MFRDRATSRSATTIADQARNAAKDGGGLEVEGAGVSSIPVLNIETFTHRGPACDNPYYRGQVVRTARDGGRAVRME